MSLDLSIRASDGDREGVVRLLREQTALGRLTIEEFEERMGAALAARTWGELRKVTTDLPVSLPFPDHGRRAGATSTWRTPAWTRGINWSDVGYWALFSLPLLVASLAWILQAPAALALVFTVLVVVVVVAGAG